MPERAVVRPAVAARLLAAPAGAVGQRGYARVAVVGPFSGPRAAWGELLTSAVRRHLIPGIAWELHDDRGDTDLARRLAPAIVADGGYRAVIGHFNSLGAAAAVPVYRSARIPVLLPLSTAPGLLVGGGGGALRWCASDHDQLAALARAACEHGAAELQVTDDGSASGGQLAAAACELATPSLPMRRLAAGEPPQASGSLMVCGTLRGATTVANGLRAAGFHGTLFFTDDCGVPKLTQLLRDRSHPAFVARLAGGAARRVEDAFAALTGALVADPALTGAELMSMIQTHAGLSFTPDGDPDPAALAGSGHGWEVIPVTELRRASIGRSTAAGRIPGTDALVIGTGITAVATAAALAELGARVAIIGPGPGAPSATRYSGGLVRAYDPDPRVRELVTRSFKLLWGLPEERLRGHGFHRTGSLVLLNPADLNEAARGVAELRAAGIDAAVLSPAEIRERWRDLAVDDVAAAVWEPAGGYTAPVATASLFRAHASRLGVASWCGRVIGIIPHETGIRAVTEEGSVIAKAAVIATGSAFPDPRTKAAFGPSARVKRIRYGYFDARGHGLPAMADLVTGMWGRPNVDAGSYLIGRPVNEWDVPPGGGDSLTAQEISYIRSGAVRRWPWLADAACLGGRYGADLYSEDGPVLGPVFADLPVIAAGAFSGNGIRSAPAAAETIANAVRALL